MIGRKPSLTDTQPTKQIEYFFMERPHPKVSGMKDTIKAYFY